MGRVVDRTLDCSFLSIRRSPSLIQGSTAVGRGEGLDYVLTFIHAILDVDSRVWDEPVRVQPRPRISGRAGPPRINVD